ncbi:MAG TPA: hypothetical protein VIT44_05040 [Cyclobacteriaceae bacterium]
MKTIWRLVIGLFLPAFVISCFNPPEYPIVPEIEFKSVKFVDTPDPAGQSIADTLVLSVDFKDGDGDIGFSDEDQNVSETTAKYQERIYTDTNGQRWAIGDLLQLSQSKDPQDVNLYNSLLKYSDKKNPPFDTLPGFIKPYTCTNWEILENDDVTPAVTIDTLYFNLNPNSYNIFVDFLMNTNGTTFEEFDFRKELCATYDGRLPILSKDISQENPLQGTIRYAMAGTGFKLIFGLTKPMKLRVTIQDRNLHKSNVIETDAFSLSEIK